MDKALSAQEGKLQQKKTNSLSLFLKVCRYVAESDVKSHVHCMIAIAYFVSAYFVCTNLWKISAISTLDRDTPILSSVLVV